MIVHEARKNGIRLILSLVNNSNVFGVKDQYVKWAQEAGVDISSSHEPFFAVKDYYKALHQGSQEYESPLLPL